LQGAVDIGVGYFPLYRLFVIVATAAVLLALWLFLEKTSFGLIIRAGARDPLIVRVLGVNVAQVWLVVFGIGTAIAGFAGLLAAPLQGVSPEMGGTILAEAFVVTVVGGMGSIGGAVLAGLLVGMVVSMSSLFAPEMTKVSIFALMAIVLIIRPQGFLRPRRVDELRWFKPMNDFSQTLPRAQPMPVSWFQFAIRHRRAWPACSF